MTTKAFAKREFCKRFLGVRRYNWLDATGLRHLGPETFARVDLDYGMTQGNYDRLVVTVLHHSRGKLDEKAFLFNDYFSERQDDRKDYPSSKGFHAWTNLATGDVEWYIAIPTEQSQDALRNALESYLECFR